jgi:outer membrane protein OmpA-like peptidoglycan-associated protein
MVFLSFSVDNQNMKYLTPALSTRHQLFSQPCTVVLMALALCTPALQAQTATPTAQEMIEKLKAQPEPEVLTAPDAPAANGVPLRTRSLRNLSIKAAKTPEGEAAVAAAQEAAPAEPPPRPSLSLMIQFDFNSAKIRPESQPALQNLATALQSKELAEANFAVEGHTDAKGSHDYNIKLSQSRADAVQKFLAAQGVPAARLVTAGKGASELANPNDPLAAENRRVRIVNLQ